MTQLFAAFYVSYIVSLGCRSPVGVCRLNFAMKYISNLTRLVTAGHGSLHSADVGTCFCHCCKVFLEG